MAVIFNKRLITHVYDPSTHDVIDVANQLDNLREKEFFHKRRYLELGIRKYLCNVCFQPVSLRSNSTKTIPHYRHKRKNVECPLQDFESRLTQEQILAMKFNGQKEGKAHRESKEFIYEAIKRDKLSRFSDPHMEVTFREQCDDPNVIMSKEWRIPDVSAWYDDNGVKKGWFLSYS